MLPPRSLLASSYPQDRYRIPLLASPAAQLLAVVLVGCVSGFVLKQQQLRAVADDLAAVYPFAARLPFVLLRVVEAFLWFSFNACLISVALRLPFFHATARLGESYGLLALAYLFGPIHRFWLFPALLVLVNVRAVFGHDDRREALAWFANHRAALGCVAVITGLYAVYFAPLLDPLIGLNQIDRLRAIIPFSLANTMRSTLPAVAGLQEPSWHPRLCLGGGSHRPELMGHQNYLLSALFELFPISSADVTGIFRLEKAAIYILYCLAGVGYYLLCRYGFRLRHGVSFIVGLVAIVSDGILTRHAEVDWGYASCTVPFVLLAVKRAREADSLWLYAVAGGTVGILQNLHFTHPEVVLAIIYFVVGWIAWDSFLTVPRDASRARRLRMLTAIAVFGIACVLANYRFVGGWLEFAYDGNQITSERLHDYGGHGPAVLARNLLGPLGLQGSGPFPEPYVPYFYGLTVAFLVILGVVRLMRRHGSDGAPQDTLLTWALVAPLLLAILSLYRSTVVGGLYGLGVPGFPFHTGIRILHPIHACLMVLFAAGLDQALASGDGADPTLDRRVVLKTLAVFLTLALLLGAHGADPDLHRVQALFAAVTMIVCCSIKMPSRVRLAIVGVMVVITAVMATREITMVIGPRYHQEVLARARVNPKVVGNTLASRLLHPEMFAPKVYPFSLATTLQPVREDLANPRTRLYLWRLTERFRADLGALIAFREGQGSEGSRPTVTEARATTAALTRIIDETRSYDREDASRIGQLMQLAPVYDQLYVPEAASEYTDLDAIVSHLPEGSPYARVAYSLPFKAKAGNDFLNDFPTFENSHYYVMGSANLRWPSSLDYFFPDVSAVMSDAIYYDADMFPPVSRGYLDLLGFDTIVATEAELPQYQQDTEVVARVGAATLLRNKAALPRAALFRSAKVIAPIRYDSASFQSMSRVEQGRAELNAIDTKRELLLEKTPPVPLPRATPESPTPVRDDVRIVRIASNFAVFRAHNAGSDALLFYTDAYHPDWRAYVDRSQREVLRADLAFKAVVVPAGDHLVWMEFVPWRAELARGIVFALAALTFMQIGRAAERRRRSEGTGTPT